jgi:hypothetical protein
MTISNANSQILKFFPRYLLNQRWKSLSLCPTAPFLDVSVWSSTANTVRKCRCRRVGFETNSSSIAVSWRSGRWRNGGDTFQVRFPVNRIIRWVPRGESETPPSDFRHGHESYCDEIVVITIYGFQFLCDISSGWGYAPIWEMGVHMALYGDAETPQVFREA